MSHFKNSSQCIQEAYDDIDKATRVKIVATDMSLSLSAIDGDSVQSVAKTVQLNPDLINLGELISSVTCYGASSVEVSPDIEGDEFYKLHEQDSGITTLNVCAMRIKITGKVLGK